MKKQFVVVRIDAAPDGGPYVLVTLSDQRDFKLASQSPAGQGVMAFTSMDELMKGLNKAFSNLQFQMAGASTTTIRLDVREYEDLNLKVGQKVYLEILPAEAEGV